MARKVKQHKEEFQLLVARGASQEIDGYRYYMQLWLGVPEVDRTARSEANCYFIYEKQGERYKAVLGKLGVEYIDAITRNANAGHAHVAICRDTPDGKVQVDHLTYHHSHALEALVLQVKGVYMMGGGF